jgi:chromosomal replication initiation ATPase DnaA
MSRYDASSRAPVEFRVAPAEQVAFAEIAALLDTTPAALCRRCREPAWVQARHAAMWLLTQRGLSRSAIGRLLGLDHSTVIHGLRRLAADAEAVARLARIERGGER